MIRTSSIALLILAACKFPELPSVDDATSTDGAVDTASFDGVSVDAPVDATPRGPLIVNNQPADVVYGQANFTSSVMRGPVANGIYYPQYLAVGGNALWVSDPQYNRVLSFPSLPPGNDPDATMVLGRSNFTDSSPITTPSSTVIGGPGGVAVSSNALVVSDFMFNRVLVWSPLPTANAAPATLVLGQTSFSGSATGASASSMNLPTRIWTDGTRLIVVDSGNNRLLVWNTFPTTNGQPADLVLGQAAFGDSSPPSSPTAGRVKSPSGVYFDGNRLYVVDAGHNRILVWNGFPNQNGEGADLVIGQPDFVTQGGEGSPHRFSVPKSVVVVDGALLVADAGNRRVLVFDPQPAQSITNVSTATQVLGQVDLTSTGDQGASPTSLQPGSLAVVGDDVFVPDIGNHRVLRFDLALP